MGAKKIIQNFLKLLSVFDGKVDFLSIELDYDFVNFHGVFGLLGLFEL